MATYDTKSVVYTEVIQDMSPQEKEHLLDELAELIQKQGSQVRIAYSGGFSHVWRVLTGKQRDLNEEIILSQSDVNELSRKMLLIIAQGQVDVEMDVHHLKKLSVLQSVLLIRISEDLKQAGVSLIDTRDLEYELLRWQQDETKKQLEESRRQLKEAQIQLDESRKQLEQMKTQIEKMSELCDKLQKKKEEGDEYRFTSSGSMGCW